MTAPRLGNASLLCVVTAVALIGAAAWFPVEWAARLPRPVEVDGARPAGDPTTGATLLRSCLLADAAALLWLAWRRRSDGCGPRTATPPPPGAGPGPASTPEIAAVATVTAIALALRLYRAGSDLWIDEIVNLQIFRDMPPLQVMVAFRIANNHPLNTLLMKAMSGVFGETEWALRLPAILFGAATVPALWATARRALGPGGAVASALLLAVSYHHIFYSQNARGYSAHLFFAVAAAGLLSRATAEGRAAHRVSYVAALFGGLAVILHGFFVLGGHAVALLARAFTGRPAGRGDLRAAARLLAIAGYAGLHLYALAIPDAVRSVGSVYRGQAVGYRPLSMDHLQELVRGLAAGAGAGGALAAAVFVALAGAGMVRAYRRDPLAIGGLAAPLLLMAAFVVAGGLNVTPRTFLLALPLGIFCGLAAVQAAAEAIAGRIATERRASWSRAGVGLATAVLAAGSVSALPRYYSAPKQDFRGAIRFLRSARAPGDTVAAVYLAGIGLRHYGPSLGVAEGRDFVTVRSIGEMEAARPRRPGGRLFAVVTLTRANRLEFPDLDARLRDRFRVLRTFRGTLGDGDVSVLVESVLSEQHQ